jgi:hypothetical protein
MNDRDDGRAADADAESDAEGATGPLPEEA